MTGKGGLVADSGDTLGESGSLRGRGRGEIDFSDALLVLHLEMSMRVTEGHRDNGSSQPAFLLFGPGPAMMG